MIHAEPFLGTKHMYRKKRLCLQGDYLVQLKQLLTTSMASSLYEMHHKEP